ncbi:hypothetical protein [Nitrincola iocasae]|uniref:Uncharacterized protein n=1 Tax=Nitrincola iocasae TaxID=2614693 RepID=A0A5J6LFR1_9GAMM|nr:hypothetical protein [Nitrincola iocasae]QEW07397.1 hypothetical protein F5I99_13350 [Nitrincola iocasae]
MCNDDEELELDLYSLGYKAFNEGDPSDSSESIEWQRGWMDAEDDDKERKQAIARRNNET